MSDQDNNTGESSNTEGNDQNENDVLDTDNEGEDNGSDTSDDGEGEGDENKPLTAKDLKALLPKVLDSHFANQRRENKNKNRSYQSDANKSGKDDKEPLNERLSAVELSHRKYDFGQEHGLNRKEVDLVFKFADGKPNAKTLENPFVKGGLERLRTQASLRDNTPEGSGSSSFEVDGKKWEDMTPEERNKNFSARQKAILGKNKK